jgi:citrate lyase subunit beta/citryl-CoA lyase
MLAKAASLHSDQLFMDLEDAVAPSQKQLARRQAVAALKSHDYAERTCTVRVNDVKSEHVLRDVIEIVSEGGPQLDCLMIPKVEGAEELHFIDHLLDCLERETPRERPIGLEVLIENPGGAAAVAQIVTASPRLEALIFGVGDYQVSMGSPRFELGVADPEFPGVQWHWTMSSIVNHARARGLQAIDGPYVALEDEQGYLASARRGKAIGFLGKWCVHPSQIDLAHRAYAPTATDVARAQSVLDAYGRALELGVGAAVFEGLMIDEASRKLAARLLADHDASGGAGPTPQRLTPVAPSQSTGPRRGADAGDDRPQAAT